MIEVECNVQRYEEPLTASPNRSPNIVVNSHHIYNDRVRLTVNGETATVIGRDIITAIENCMRIAR